MTSSPLLAGAVGALFAVGVTMAVAGWYGLLDRPAPTRPAVRGRFDRLAVRAALAVSATAGTAWATRWPVAVVGMGAVGWLAPSVVGLRARRRRELARSEAVAAWAEMLRDLLTSNAGLHEAIGKSARVAPEAIRDEVTALYVRAQRGDLAVALARFADELADPIADTVVAALQIADQRAVSDVGGLLAAVANSTRDTVAMQLRVNATRARTYRTAQLISVIVGFFITLLVLANREYMEPFGTVAGQVVLGIVVLLLAGSGWAMIALSKPARSERLLAVGSADRGVRA